MEGTKPFEQTHIYPIGVLAGTQTELYAGHIPGMAHISSTVSKIKTRKWYYTWVIYDAERFIT